MLQLAEAAFGPQKGPEKQQAVVGAVAKGLTDAGVAQWIVSVVAALLGTIIPMLIEKYNNDPGNSVFVKSPRPT